MRKRYQQIDKVKALQVLDANGGNIGLTVAELRIAERTLRDWDEFRQAIAKAFFTPKEKPEPVYPRPLDEDEDEEDVPEEERLAIRRQEIMQAQIEAGERHRCDMHWDEADDRLL